MILEVVIWVGGLLVIGVVICVRQVIGYVGFIVVILQQVVEGVYFIWCIFVFQYQVVDVGGVVFVLVIVVCVGVEQCGVKIVVRCVVYYQVVRFFWVVL